MMAIIGRQRPTYKASCWTNAAEPFVDHAQDADMPKTTLESILAANINKMIDRDLRPGERRSVRAWAIARDLDVRAIDRITKGQNIRLDTLYEVAQATGLQPWMLLLEDFDPAAPPDAPISESDRQMLTRLRRLLGPDA